MTDFTDAEIHAATRDYIAASVREIEPMDIGTMMAKDLRFATTFGPAFHSTRERIAEAMGTATITVTWPGAQDGDDADEAALLEILTSAGDGGTYVEKCVGDFDRTRMCPAEDSNLPEQLLTWHRAGVQAEHDRMAGQLAQLRHVIDNQAQKLESYAQQHIADAKRVVELEAELGGSKAVDEQCTATTGRRLVVQCSREAGHDDAHTAEIGGGRISWHGKTAAPTFECEVCTKEIAGYPCVLCEHEPAPWPGA